MPIKPENRKRYPANWKQIREEILKRADNKCEHCGIENGSIIIDACGTGQRTYIQPRANRINYEIMKKFLDKYPKYIVMKLSTGEWVQIKQGKVVLTVAHLDHTPENCDPSNLRALCQKCHNQYDAKHRAETRKTTNVKKIPT